MDTKKFFGYTKRQRPLKIEFPAGEVRLERVVADDGLGVRIVVDVGSVGDRYAGEHCWADLRKGVNGCTVTIYGHPNSECTNACKAGTPGKL